ncbi:hypothetical protein [Vallitalea maricola]|uniref:Uncharacterized protein n=1 Tax=Vallitalea maricola TaxID=3074433 RepID=A0ACB5UE87_9FIRM|nr:hypothetical protein AN2V17_00950 [Vallitalea sp. AN17-2]
MAKYKSFEEFKEYIDKLSEKQSAEDLLVSYNKEVKELSETEIENNYFMVTLLKACICMECKRYDECVDLIKEVVMKGYACPLNFKMFKPIYKKFEECSIIDLNNALLEELRENSKAIYQIHLPKNYNPRKKYPLFLALHGDGLCNIKEFSQYWKPDVFVSKDYIFAYLQASHLVCQDGHGWVYDIKQARKDIKKLYRDIISEYPIDEEQVLIGGYSGGAIASIDAVMCECIPAKGFICLCPGEKTDAFTYENVKKAFQKGIRGIFMEGVKDMPIQDEEEMIKTFDEVGLKYEFYVNEGVGHEIPDDFNENLQKALNFINIK